MDVMVCRFSEIDLSHPRCQNVLLIKSVIKPCKYALFVKHVYFVFPS